MTALSRRLPVVAAVVAALGVSSAWAGWVDFTEETNTRIVADPGLVLNDPQEKDYAFGDLDMDGDDDLVIVRKSPFTTAGAFRNVLLMNENGILVDRTDQYIAGFLDETDDRDVQVADVTGDGLPDIITATTFGFAHPANVRHPRVYNNLGASDGQWQGFGYDPARIPAFNPAGAFAAVAVGDVDGVNGPDLYFVSYNRLGGYGGDLDDRLLINNGSGYFSDETTSRLTSEMYISAFGTMVEIADVNGDGLNDIIKDSTLFDEPLTVDIYYNDGGGFYSIREELTSGDPYFVVKGDFNNDTKVDFYVTGDASDHVHLNQGNGPDGRADFDSDSIGGTNGFGGSTHVADLNNDGFDDVLVCGVDIDIQNCGASNRLFLLRNLGNVPDVTLQDQSGNDPWLLRDAFDVAAMDINGDTWLDMVVGTCTGTRVFIQDAPAGLTFVYPLGLPGFASPGQGTSFEFEVRNAGSEPAPGTGTMFVSVNGGPFVETPVDILGPNHYEATLPPTDCPGTIKFYVSAEDVLGNVFLDPTDGEANPYSAIVAVDVEVTFIDDYFQDLGWTVFAGATDGNWVRVDPVGTIDPGTGFPAQPETDHTGTLDQFCYVTGQGVPGGPVNADDLDGGPTILTSPPFDLDNSDANVGYFYWVYTSAGIPDTIDVAISNDDGQTWIPVRSLGATGSVWALDSFLVSDYVTPTAEVRVRFSGCDCVGAGSITELGVDDFQIEQVICALSAPPLVAAVTRADHGPAGVIDLPIDLTAEHAVDSGAVTTESRQSGVTELRLTFAAPLDPSAGGLNELAVNIGSDPPGASIPAITTSLEDSDSTLVVTFASALPDEHTYTIEVTDAVTGSPEDKTFELRALVGNVANDPGAGPQVVNAIDLGLAQGIRGQFLAPGELVDETNAKFDVNLDGTINAPDLSYVRLNVFQNTAP